MDELSGEVKNIIYRNGENGFTVLTLVDDTGDEHTAVGSMPLAGVGERIELTGDWTEHRAYGRQLAVRECRTLAPATLGALTDYLGSGLIKGIGESTARALVSAFGEDTLSIMENEPERLMEVYGIGRARAASIHESYMLQRGMKDIMLSLGQYGITVGQSMKLYRLYENMCLVRVKENPYRLIDDIEGIGFVTADRIAENVGIEHDSDFRIRAGIKYTLQWARQEGHTYLPRERLVEVAAKNVLHVDIAPVERALDMLILENELVYGMVGNTDGVFLTYMYSMESECAKRLVLLANTPVQNGFMNIAAEIQRLENEIGVGLAPQQREAVETAMTNGAMVITGGPGTGKTTILQFIIRLSERMGLDYELCAPTGRAAKRMGEAAGCEARTIHRMLEYGFGEDSFTRNEESPIDADMIIVDEMSMVDIPLLYALLRAVRRGTRLILVGDADQLPPVGPGNALRDIIDSGVFPVIRLTEIFRQSGRSAIVENAHRINQGRMPALSGEGGDFGFEEIYAAEAIIGRVIELCTDGGGTLGTREPLKDIEVLAPMKKGPLGVNNLNARLQAALNPPMHKKRERKFGDIVFREGDKVMQVKNDYRIEWTRTVSGDIERGEGVYNGDLGTIMRIDLAEQFIEVLFDDERTAYYDYSMLDELTLAYCISIHKSQGSEFPIALLPLAGGPPMLMTRNLLYTAVTRARRQAYIVGHADAVRRMVDNADTKKRYSALQSLLENAERISEGRL